MLYRRMRPSRSKQTMLDVVMVVESLKRFSSPSASAIAMFSAESEMTKCTVESVWYSLKS